MEFTLYSRKFKLIDYDLYSFHKRGKNQVETWHQIKLTLEKKSGYARFRIPVKGKQKSILFHRAVYYANNPQWNFYDTSKENYIDHFDAKEFPPDHPKNNHIENLRVVTNQENQFNRHNRGCSFDKEKGKYRAQICLNNKHIHIGYYNTEQEAHQAYLEKKKEVHVIRANR